MNLEDQVCSLELSKRLKELGIKQESLFYWCNVDNWKYKSILKYCPDVIDRELALSGYAVSAFTVAELFELLPVEIEKGFLGYLIKKYDYYEMSYSNILECFDDKNPANCLAKMLIHYILLPV